MYCTKCGKEVRGQDRFCTSCGLPVSAQQSQHVTTEVNSAPTPATRVVVVEPKRAGRLALIGFCISAVILGIGSSAANRSAYKSNESSLKVLAMGVGAAYIVTNLRKWKRQNDLVRGGATAWTVAALLILGCVSSIIQIGQETHSGPQSAAAEVNPKGVLLREVKLDYTWSKQGFGNIMSADFTVHNPTQYRFKDFEIKCTHFAPSGTQIDSNTKTLYEVIEPNSTKVFASTSMGFIHSQAVSSNCEITDLTVLQQ